MSTQVGTGGEQHAKRADDEAELRSKELDEVAGGAPFAPSFQYRPIVDPLPEKIWRKRLRKRHSRRRQAPE